MEKKPPKIKNLENVGPDKPIEELQEVVTYLKRLSASLERPVPYTANRLRQCIMVIKKTQQRINTLKKR